MALNLRIPSRAAGNALSPHLTTLSISWLNKQFKAVAIHRGVVQGTWEKPEEVEGASHFEGLLKEAIRNTGYHGQTVTLLLGHQRLVQQLVDLPPVKGNSLTKLVQRQAAQQKVFQGEAAHAFEFAPSPKGMQRVILHLFPRILLQQLAQACRNNELHLRAVIPPSAVVRHQIFTFPANRDDVDLLAAETAGTTTVVIARNDGDILLARTLPGTWNDDLDRLAVDLNRTILFAGQQYGLTIKKELWLFGPGAKEQSLPLQEKLQLMVKLSPTDDTPQYWATEAAKLNPSAVPNFITAEMQRAPQRRVFAKIAAAGTALVFLVSLCFTAYALLQDRQEAVNVANLNQQISKMQAQLIELQRHNYDLARKQQISTMVVDLRPSPVPVWLLAYLSEAMPPDLFLNDFSVIRTNDVWQVRLAGVVSGAAANAAANPVELFRSQLKDGPFALALASANANQANAAAAALARTSSPGGTNTVIADWLNRMKPLLQSSQGRTNAPAPAETEFEIKGVMR